MRITQQHIARMAGVSQATVSRVLSGDDRVEPEIKDRVLAVVRDQKYRLDARARSLRKQETHMVGLVVKHRPDIKGDPFFASLTGGILETLADTDYHLCVDLAHEGDAQIETYEELLRTRRVDGLILVESEPDDQRIKALSRDQFPFVVIGNPGIEGIASVDNDNVLAGAMATQHLIDQGYTNIAFLAGPEEVTVSQDRILGYEQALDKAGLKPSVAYSAFGQSAARQVARDVLMLRHRPDAIVVLDDLMAMGVIQAAQEMGLAIPEELGIISFNNSILSEVVNGGLSSIDLNIAAMARASVASLLDLIESGSTPEMRVLVPSSLVPRGSSQRKTKTPR